MNFYNIKKNFTFVVCIYFLFGFLLTGCDSFRRKFVRKPKKSSAEAVVYDPIEYSRYKMAAHDTYKTHFTIWENWHLELLQRLEPEGNKKKWLDCIDEQIKNLRLMQDIVASSKKRLLFNEIIEDLYDLREDTDDIATDSDVYRLRPKAERLGRKIHRELVYSKIKEYLIPE